MANNEFSQDTSVVICVKNGESIIGPALESVLKNKPREVIVVDGRSTDRTAEIVRSMGVPFFSDEGKGLAYARRVGVEKSSGRWVLFVGPDNVLPESFIDDFVSLKQQWGFHAASAQTRVLSPQTYWDRGGDFRWVCIMGKPGPRTIVGTPSVYDRELFDTVKFSEKDFGPSDDTDVAEQLLQKGAKLGVVPLLVHEQPGWTMSMTWKRYRWYGTGDYFFYHRYRQNWTLARKLKSLTHPLRQTMRYMGIGLRQGRFDVAPWLLLTALARYKGWVEFAWARKAERN